MNALPGFLPGVAASLAAAALAARPLATRLCTMRPIAFALVASVGVIASATLTPFTGSPTPHPGSCDMTRIGPAPIQDLLRPGDVTGNVLLFVPLGVCLGLLPRSRVRTVLVAAAVAFPFAIEGTQLVLVPLNRACESADVADNLTGLVLGGVVAVLGRMAFERRLVRR